MLQCKLILIGLVVLFFTACASLPDNQQRHASQAFIDTAATVIAQGIQLKRKQSNADEAESGMLLLPDGVDALVARLALARAAERSVDVQYYLFNSDLSGGLLKAELWAAAERGVRLRILLDDMDLGDRDETLTILNAHANIDVRIFNPFIRGKNRNGQLVTRLGSVTRRMHNKAFIVDNQIAIIGGRNIGDEYFGANPNLAFGDLDVALTEPAAREVSTQFDLYWNSDLSYPVENLIKRPISVEELLLAEKDIVNFYEQNKNSDYVQRLANSGVNERVKSGGNEYHWGKAIILYDDPLKISSHREQTDLHLIPKLMPFLNAVEQELIVISPYFVPGKEGVKFFQGLRQRGVTVKILTNSLTSNDVPIVHSAYAKYREQLLVSGVELYEMNKSLFDKNWHREKSRKTRNGISGSKSSLHAKYFILDREQAFIGSLNLDPRSVVENTEIGAIIDAPDLAIFLAEGFDETIHKIAFKLTLEEDEIVWQSFTDAGQYDKRFEADPYSSWWDRFSIGFMQLLPGESQL